MTLPQTARPLRSLAITAVAGLMTIASFGATISPANAASGAYYRAELASPVEQRTKEVVGGILWVCEGTSCVAARGGARPASMCKRVVREFGEVSSFRFGDKEMEAAKLESCNAG